mgnify:CR=1 FL=1
MEKKKKVVYGQFFTKEDVWLKEHVKEFILGTGTSIAYDPFAGAGDLLNAAEKLGYKQLKGLDIDERLSWAVNDSLLHIPTIDNAIIITNPPYISNYSAARKGVASDLQKYFQVSVYDDVYLIALDKMLEAEEYVVAIVPETFINSNYKNKDRLHSITILEDNPFTDTDTPVIVACFDGKNKKLEDVNVYKNDVYINNLGNIEKMRLYPHKDVDIIFNDRNGWLGVRCVDSTNPKNMLKFDFKENIDYDWNNGIKVSSRLLTLVKIDVIDDRKPEFITECNRILNDIRDTTDDVILSPFKGNMKNGRRRRRLDFLTCRAILEKAYYKTNGIKIGDLFDAN